MGALHPCPRWLECQKANAGHCRCRDGEPKPRAWESLAGLRGSAAACTCSDQQLALVGCDCEAQQNLPISCKCGAWLRSRSEIERRSCESCFVQDFGANQLMRGEIL